MNKDSPFCKIKQAAGYGLHHIWNKSHMVTETIANIEEWF